MSPGRSASLGAVFVDSSAYLALRDPHDAQWGDAVVIVRRLSTSWPSTPGQSRIDHLQGDPRAQLLLVEAFRTREERVVASVMTRIEVLAGMRPNEEAATRRLLSLFEWIPVDETIADRAGDPACRYLHSHPGVDVMDHVIAATFEELGAELWTRNLQHFPMLSDLRDP